MDDLSLEIFSSIISNSNYDFFEIKLYYSKKCVEITIIDKKNEFNTSNISIKFLQPEKLLNNHYLPDKLKKLFIHNDQITKNITLNCLPNELKKLRLSGVKSKLDNLPSSLEVLELELNTGECSFDYLPSSLKTLIIQSNCRDYLNLNNLPSSLENLLLLTEYTKDLTNLPSGLKFLQIETRSNIKINLPKNIKCVNYPEDNNSLRRNFTKLYPKVIYNDDTYERNIEVYDEYIEFKNIENFKSDSDSDSDSESESNNSKLNCGDGFDFDKLLIYNNRR
jgi:hypothetical protein